MKRVTATPRHQPRPKQTAVRISCKDI